MDSTRHDWIGLLDKDHTGNMGTINLGTKLKPHFISVSNEAMFGFSLNLQVSVCVSDSIKTANLSSKTSLAVLIFEAVTILDMNTIHTDCGHAFYFTVVLF